MKEDLVKKIYFMYMLVIILSASFMRTVQNFIVELLGEGAIKNIVILVTLIVVVISIYLLKQFKESLRKNIIVLAVSLIFCLSFMATMHFPAERMHVIEYGIVGAFGVYVFREQPKSKMLLLSFSIGMLCACLDEGFQYFLPDRFGDLKDVLINMVSIIWGIGTITSLKINYKDNHASS